MLELDDIARVLHGRTPQVIEGGDFEAAVAMVLRHREHPEALFIERARHPGDPWSGHMAFPGGRRDPVDESVRHTAERETLEEVGLDLAPASLLGRLDDQSGRRAGQGRQLVISAFVYRIGPEEIELELSREVEEAMWVPIHTLLDPDAHVDYSYHLAPGETFPGILVGEPDRHVIWGLTLRFLTAFFAMMEAPFPPGER